MIIRVVKMYFIPDREEEFLEIFDRTKEAIRSIEGCSHLELLRDTASPNTYITISHWSEAGCLEKYRRSELFKNVWGRVKTLFSKPAEAFSMEKYIEV